MKGNESESLDECQKRVQDLEEENRTLRKSSDSFGHLAERLSQTLDRERRQRAERRASVRPSPDRRQQL